MSTANSVLKTVSRGFLHDGNTHLEGCSRKSHVGRVEIVGWLYERKRLWDKRAEKGFGQSGIAWCVSNGEVLLSGTGGYVRKHPDEVKVPCHSFLDNATRLNKQEHLTPTRRNEESPSRLHQCTTA